MALNSRGYSGEPSWLPRGFTVEVKSATLLNSPEDKHNVSIVMEIINPKHHHRIAGSNLKWDQKFVFCYKSEKSRACISFGVFAKKNYFRDDLMGIAFCNLDVDALRKTSSLLTDLQIISEDKVSVGKLTVEFTRVNLGCVGGYGRKKFVMNYDEFLMLEKRPALTEEEKKKKKIKNFTL